MDSIEVKMDEIIDFILSSIEYQNYQVALVRLDQEQSLLAKYQSVIEEYNEQKKYEKYIDISSTKEKLKEVKNELNENKIVREYYDAYHQLNQLLDEVTHIIFEGLLDPSNLQPYFK